MIVLLICLTVTVLARDIVREERKDGKRLVKDGKKRGREEEGKERKRGMNDRVPHSLSSLIVTGKETYESGEGKK